MTTEPIDLKTELIADFRRRELAMNGEAKTSFHQTRQQALERFETLGFPTPRNEEWKYSNVRNLISHTYNFSGKHAVTAETIREISIPNLTGNVLYFVNGHYEPSLSRVVSPAEQMTILPLREALEDHPELVSSYFGVLTNTRDEAFTALNTAFAGEGIFIHVPKGKVCLLYTSRCV